MSLSNRSVVMFQILASEPKKLGQKLWVYFNDFWNIVDTFAIILFVVGAILRGWPQMLQYGKVRRVVDNVCVIKFVPFVQVVPGPVIKHLSH